VEVFKYLTAAVKEGSNQFLASVEKETVGLHSERQFQVNIDKIHPIRGPEALE